jgi:hypothetical protein
MRRSILLALLLACGAVHAADWRPIGKTANGNDEVFVDVSSILFAGSSMRQASIKTVHAPHSGPQGDRETQSIASYSFNCVEQTFRHEAFIAYYEDGTDHAMPADRYPDAWEPVPPDTVLSAEMQFVCTFKAKPK